MHLWIALICFWITYGGRASRIVDDIPEKDLLLAIKVPFEDTSTQYFESGFDGFPAWGLRPGSDIKNPYRLFMPERFYAEFSILFTIKLVDREGGFLFAVVNPLETVVELGVSVKVMGPMDSNVSLYYTDPESLTSDVIASFIVPTTFSRWSTVTFRVTTEEVAIGFNCQFLSSKKVTRRPLELVFDSASILYIGQAGPIIKGAFHSSR